MHSACQTTLLRPTAAPTATAPLSLRVFLTLHFPGQAAHGSTCQGRPGSYEYEKIDSQSYCQFGIDYLKIDQCGGDSYEAHGQNKNISWLKFQSGLKQCLSKTGRAIVQSVESCGTVAGCGEWIANCANLWRTGSDLEATWGSIMKNLDQTAPLFSLAEIRDDGGGVRSGHWCDPDMCVRSPLLVPCLPAIHNRSHGSSWLAGWLAATHHAVAAGCKSEMLESQISKRALILRCKQSTYLRYLYLPACLSAFVLFLTHLQG